MKKDSHKKTENVAFSLVSFIFLVLVSASFVSAAHLVGNKDVSPNVLNVGDNATITLTVSGVGNPVTISNQLDVFILIDTSCSIDYCELRDEKTAAMNLVNSLSNGVNRVGVITFNTNYKVRTELTSDYSSVIKSINGISSRTGNTNIGQAIGVASSKFDSNSNTKVIILLSDGRANLPKNAEDYAITQANLARGNKVIVYTVGFGEKVDVNLMKKIADDKVTGSYHHYTNVSQLVSNFRIIFDSISKKTNNLAGRNIVITDILEQGVVPVYLPTGCSSYWSAGDNYVSCNAGSLNIGESRSFSFRVAVYNPSLNHLNKIAYVDYINSQNVNVRFNLNNPIVIVNDNCPDCDPVDVCVGNVAPNITILSPLGKTYKNGTTSVNIQAVDDNLENVWYNLNGVNTSYSSPLKVTLTNGNYRLYAYANDSCGNVSSTFVDFIINGSSNNDDPVITDNIGPNVTIISPVEKVYNTKRILLNITAVDDIAVESVWYTINGQRYDYNSSYYMNLEEGYYTILAYANDSSGNIGSDGVSFQVKLSDNGGCDGICNNRNKCTSCGTSTRAPVNDFDSSETAGSIFMDEPILFIEEEQSTYEEDQRFGKHLSGDLSRLAFNMILLIAIVILLLLIVLIGRRDN